MPFARRALITTTVATDLVWYAKYDSERSVDPQVIGPRRVLPAPPHALRRGRVPEHAPAAELRDRPAVAAPRERRRSGGRVPAHAEALARGRRAARGDHAVRRRRDLSTARACRRRSTATRPASASRSRHQLTPLTTLRAASERLRRRSFPFSPERDTDSFRVMPGVEFKPRALINGSAYVGLPPVHAAGRPVAAGVQRPRLAPRPVLHAARRDDVRRQLSPRPELLVRGAAAVLRERTAWARRCAARSAAGSTCSSRPTATVYAYSDLRSACRSPAQRPARRQRVDTTWNYAGSLGYRLGHDGRASASASPTGRANPRPARSATYDGLRVGHGRLLTDSSHAEHSTTG